MVRHNVYLDIPECFVVFNDVDVLPFDPVLPEDLCPVQTTDSTLAGYVWSADCQWYFIITDSGIFLFNIDGSGWFCRKRSAEFIRMFVDAPKGSKR